MDYRAALSVLFFGALLLVAPSCYAGDLEDVQAVWDQGLKAYNARDADALYANVHEQAMGFGPIAPFPYDGTAMPRQGLTAFFASLESVNVVPINFQFRVFGNTAVGAGNYVVSVKPKDGPMVTTFGRYTVTYAKIGDKWVSVSDHNSSIPAGN